MRGYFGQGSMVHIRWSKIESLKSSHDTPVESLESSHSPRVESLESSRVEWTGVKSNHSRQVESNHST